MGKGNRNKIMGSKDGMLPDCGGLTMREIGISSKAKGQKPAQENELGFVNLVKLDK